MNLKRKSENEDNHFTNKSIMIITFGTQKGGTGKTTLAIAFCNYLASLTERQINVFDFDYQKSFYTKWEEDKVFEEPQLYNVQAIGFDNEMPFKDLEDITALKESDEINVFDLAGTLDHEYSDLLVYSDFVVIPFEYSDISIQSTLVFVDLMHRMESQAERIFIRSKYDKGYKYPNQEGIDQQLNLFGTLLKDPVFKRNALQKIDTIKLTYEQKLAVKNPFNELINYMNETLEITI